jgi:hypothetical protein
LADRLSTLLKGGEENELGKAEKKLGKCRQTNKSGKEAKGN